MNAKMAAIVMRHFQKAVTKPGLAVSHRAWKELHSFARVLGMKTPQMIKDARKLSKHYTYNPNAHLNRQVKAMKAKDAVKKANKKAKESLLFKIAKLTDEQGI